MIHAQGVTGVGGDRDKEASVDASNRFDAAGRVVALLIWCGVCLCVVRHGAASKGYLHLTDRTGRKLPDGRTIRAKWKPWEALLFSGSTELL